MDRGPQRRGRADTQRAAPRTRAPPPWPAASARATGRWCHVSGIAREAEYDRPLERILSRLHGARRSAAGWEARCPAHEDRRASLSVSEGSDGRVLLKCHAGCANRDIVAALGMTMADLFPPRERRAGAPASRIVATYDYTDAAGVLLYQVVLQPVTSVHQPVRVRPRGTARSRA